MRRRKDSTSPGSVKSECHWCGGDLEEDGFCTQMGGFPYGTSCPFACPMCGGKLNWDGGCNNSICSMKEGRPYFPGDAYRVQKQHWVFSGTGPHLGLSQEETLSSRQIVNMVLSGDMTVDKGIQAIAFILDGIPKDLKRAASGERVGA